MGQKHSHGAVAEMRAAAIADTRAKVAEHGWTVIGVFPTPDRRGPNFAYTVGLSARGLPELAIYGLHTQIAHSLLNEVARRMVESGVALQTGDRIERVLVDDVPLVTVAMTDTTDLNMVRECYGAVAAAVQVVWPDGAGVLPWEDGSRLTDDDQPVRGRPPAARPLYHANRLPVTTAQELADLIGEQPKQTTLTREGTGPRRDNDIRAGWAGRALVAYATHLGGSSLTEEVETAASDLLCDMRHLFDALGVDWEAAVTRSDDHYRGEIFGEV
ncbi:DUF4262 domain-containing protein (plasmid) [Mycolicibacterium fluoranthenivorans]|uniref:DUF4262 domain-containing protein n=1 Tax=Mycolicibacterium fluoranthenivorans TaxID=258505 RepID=A0A7G8P6Q2_9MYCO|nr:DUF4262 domain-containing protein [Mycolicibacterium fluoranthenivorans]QNJ90018.1 DUF4262 domain-containing protein [Mycolicibacterium fluoranthenivorans]